MEAVQIIFQILTVIISVIAILQKQKWKMMLYYTIDNILSVIMYFSFNRITTAIICIVATIRTFIFMFYSLKKLKPNIIWLIIFETGFVVTTILTWQDALDLLPLVAILSSGYGSWQDNPVILRVSYIINNGSYVIYSAVIGAYISMVFKIITFLSSVFCFIYYCLLKKETPILDVIFKRKKTVENNIDNTNIVDDNNKKEEPINNDINNVSDTKNDENIDNTTNNTVT